MQTSRKQENILAQQNKSNLTALWKRMGVTSELMSDGYTVFRSKSWPHRIWVEDNTGMAVNHCNFQLLEKHNIVPTWENQLQSHSIQIDDQPLDLLFSQTAMVLSMQGQPINTTQTIQVTEVDSDETLQHWLTIASEAFAYEIDKQVIAPLVSAQDISLLLAFSQGKPIATGLLYKTGNILGVHQIGVAKNAQGQGIARQLMYYVIEAARSLKVDFITLQASEAGLGLYRRLGFKVQFNIGNYQA